MAFRIETRQEMLSGFRYAAIIEEQKRFGYFLGSWVFADVSDEARAAKTRQEILTRNKVNENATTRYVVEKVLSSLDDSAWRWFDFATKWTLSYTKQEVEAYQNGQITQEEYQTRLNGLVEDLITQVNQGSANYTKTQASEEYSQWTPQQLEQWNKENNQGDRLEGSKFYKYNPIYKYENGWTMVQLEDSRDYEMIGEELKNCTRHEAPNGWKNHPGMFALVDPEGDPKAVARFGGNYDEDGSMTPGEPEYMSICYEFQSQSGGFQEPAHEYKDYLFEFLDKTTPEQFGFEGEAWENESPVKQLHEIEQRYENGERDFKGANLKGANLGGADLKKANLEGANLEEANLEGANLMGAYLAGADLGGAYLAGADLGGASLKGANLKEANLMEANLRVAYLPEANLEGANLMGANLEGANLMGAYLMQAHLVETYLVQAYLAGADLAGADLGGADLKGANLEGANLVNAYLVNANLAGAILRGAELRGAELRGAYLLEANLVGANLREANLVNAHLERVIYDSTTQWPEGFTPPQNARLLDNEDNEIAF